MRSREKTENCAFLKCNVSIELNVKKKKKKKTQIKQGLQHLWKALQPLQAQN